MATKMLLAGILALSFSAALASVVPVQDFCVADPTGQALVNGMACKDPALVDKDSFFGCGLDKPGNTSNPLGSKVTPFNVAQIPGLNTLGLAMARIDFAPWGMTNPHSHPRASEILTVLEGSIEVGFITTQPEFRNFKKVLRKGDLYVFPLGLIHYLRNVDKVNAVAIAAYNHQNPGTIPISTTLFHSQPNVCDDILAKTFKLDKKVVQGLQAQP